MQTDDAALLRSYVEDRSEAAFAQLVQRHIGLVYSTALRRLNGDAPLADDVTQAVFIALARKAPSLRHHATLSGWLYVSTQLATADTVRREQRRKHRETAAHSMHLADASSPSDPDAAKLRPVLDDAIVSLKQDEREAILLRFFEKRSFAEIGAALRVTEEAARKRVDRALEKLHAVLTRRGITSTTAALGLALAASGTAAIPVGLAAHVSSTALAHSAGTATVVSTLSAVSSVAIPLAAALVLGSVAILPLRRANESTTADLARLAHENQSLATLRFETHRLAADLAVARDLEHAIADLPALRARLAALPPPATPATIGNTTTVTPDGRLIWNKDPITLDEFLFRLRALQQTGTDPNTVFLIRAHGGNFYQMMYPLVEATKAGIKRIVVESDDAFLRPPTDAAWF